MPLNDKTIDNVIRISLLAAIAIWSIAIIAPFIGILLWAVIVAVSEPSEATAPVLVNNVSVAMSAGGVVPGGSPAFGFDYPHDSATIYGDGTNRMSWVSHKDVARTVAEAVSNPSAKNAILPVGGPSIHTPLEVVRIFEKTSGKTWTITHVPVETLQEQKSAATDEVQEAVAALQLGYAVAPGWDMNPEDYLVSSDLRSVEQYAQEVAK